MKCVARTMNRGRSCFNALLMYSYSLVAISKSCSSFPSGQLRSSYSRVHDPHLEQVLLVAQGFLLLVPQLGQGVVEPVVIQQLVSASAPLLCQDNVRPCLVIPLCDGLAYCLYDRLELLDRCSYSGLDELQLRANEKLEFLHCSLVLGNASDGVAGVGVFTNKIVFSRDGGKDRDHMLSVAIPGGEQGCTVHM